jgi:membrane-associated protein
MNELFSLFSAIPLLDPVEIIKWAGVIGVALIVFAESGLLIGFFLPGDSLLFTAGFLTQTQFLSLDINLLVLLLFAAAVAGDSVGYTFGRRVGGKLYERPNSRWFKQEHVQKAEAFYEQYGGKTIIIARFIPFVRTFAPIIAGTAKMKYRKFISYNVIGAALWAGGVTYLGYFLGEILTKAGFEIDQVLLPIIAIIILVSVLPPIIHLLKDKKRRDVLWAATKLQIAKLLKKK